MAIVRVSLFGTVDPEDTTRAKLEAAMKGESTDNIVFNCLLLFTFTFKHRTL